VITAWIGKLWTIYYYICLWNNKKTKGFHSCLLMYFRNMLQATSPLTDMLFLGALLWDDAVIQDHLDHGASEEPMNPLWTRILRFLWYTMIQAILDHWYWSGSSQRNALFVWTPFSMRGCFSSDALQTIMHLLFCCLGSYFGSQLTALACITHCTSMGPTCVLDFKSFTLTDKNTQSLQII